MTNAKNVSTDLNPEIIAIDWEIHQLIELERKGFDEPPIEALRRLLHVKPKRERKEKRTQASPPITRKQLPKEWALNGVTIPNGTRARFNYRRGGIPIFGEFRDGQLHAAGRAYDSLSEAANDLAITQAGKKTRLNGWLYWAVELPNNSGHWIIMDHLRKDASKGD